MRSKSKAPQRPHHTPALHTYIVCTRRQASLRSPDRADMAVPSLQPTHPAHCLRQARIIITSWQPHRLLSTAGVRGSDRLGQTRAIQRRLGACPVSDDGCLCRVAQGLRAPLIFNCDHHNRTHDGPITRGIASPQARQGGTWCCYHFVKFTCTPRPSGSQRCSPADGAATWVL